MLYGIFHGHGGYPHSWMVYGGKYPLKWMISRGAPISGTQHMYPHVMTAPGTRRYTVTSRHPWPKPPAGQVVVVPRIKPCNRTTCSTVGIEIIYPPVIKTWKWGKKKLQVEGFKRTSSLPNGGFAIARCDYRRVSLRVMFQYAMFDLLGVKDLGIISIP